MVFQQHLFIQKQDSFSIEQGCKKYSYILVSKDKTQIKIKKSKKDRNIFNYLGSRPIVDFINSTFLYIIIIRCDLKILKVNSLSIKFILFKLDVQSCFSPIFQNQIDILNMFLKIFCKNQSIVKVFWHKYFQIFSKNLIGIDLVSFSSVCQSKLYYFVLKLIISGPSHFPFISGTNSNEILSLTSNYLCKVLGSLKSVKHLKKLKKNDNF